MSSLEHDIGHLCPNKSKEELMIEEIKAENKRHQLAVRNIMRKYIPNYDCEIDRRFIWTNM